MHVKRTLVVACLLLQTALNFPSTSPSYERTKGLKGTLIPQASKSPLSRSKDHEHPHKLVLARSGKRNDDEEDDLRIRRIDLLTSTVPISEAAHDLEIFYNSVLYNAIAVWVDMPPQLTLSMSLGCLQLRMSVVMNLGPPRGIPWAFVRNFARNMLVMTRTGFAGTYVMYYSSIRDAFAPEFGVEVELRVFWANTGQHLPPQESFPRAISLRWL